MTVWQFIDQKIALDTPVVLLYVLQSQGSSPGRQGFKMAFALDGEMCGSIGGGIMEHKLIEKARNMMQKQENLPFFKHQIHNKKSPTNQSGMICSGEQTVVLYWINAKRSSVIQQLQKTLQEGKSGLLSLSNDTFLFEETSKTIPQYNYHYQSETNWHFQEKINHQNVLHIIGGGHVGLAFSKQMALLDFYIKIYDDRADLNTMAQNHFAHEKIITPYEKIGTYISEGANQYVVIMTFGYRMDKIVFRALMGKQFVYIGMMGSAAKIKQLLEEYKAEGIAPEKWKKLHAPIGLPIHSKTPEEIAISIAAEIIQTKNKNLPTGRRNKN